MASGLPVMIGAGARPRLLRGVRLRWDRVRGRWLLLAPERGFVLRGSGAAIVQKLGGGATLAEIAEAAGGPVEEVVAFVRALAARGLVEA